jgi:iron complex transport system substrate-binding protein
MAIQRGAVVACAALLAACGPSDTPAPTTSGPPRVVSLSPAASQFVLALGAGAWIVGVDAASARIPQLSQLPVLDLVRAAELTPDLVLVPRLSGDAAAGAEALRAGGAELFEVAPHDFDDAFALCRDLGAQLVGRARAAEFEGSLSRELARIGGASYGRPRPRVAALVGFAPLELAGGHSFATDLIEIAGGSSVSHETGEPRSELTPDRLRALAPDLLLAFSPRELPPRERDAVLEALPGGYRVEFFAFDAPLLWMREGVDAAQRLRAVIAPLSEELARSAQ